MVHPRETIEINKNICAPIWSCKSDFSRRQGCQVERKDFLSLYKLRLRLWTEQETRTLLSPTPGRGAARTVTEENDPESLRSPFHGQVYLPVFERWSPGDMRQENPPCLGVEPDLSPLLELGTEK